MRTEVHRRAHASVTSVRSALLPRPPAHQKPLLSRAFAEIRARARKQYWRIGSYLTESESIEEVEKGVFIPFIHRPLSRYVNALADNGLYLRKLLEPAPPAGFLAMADEYAAAATIPRLLVLVTERFATDGGRY